MTLTDAYSALTYLLILSNLGINGKTMKMIATLLCCITLGGCAAASEIWQDYKKFLSVEPSTPGEKLARCHRQLRNNSISGDCAAYAARHYRWMYRDKP